MSSIRHIEGSLYLATFPKRRDVKPYEFDQKEYDVQDSRQLQDLLTVTLFSTNLATLTHKLSNREEQEFRCGISHFNKGEKYGLQDILHFLCEEMDCFDEGQVILTLLEFIKTAQIEMVFGIRPKTGHLSQV
jgi:hypothetical protein